MNITRLRNLFKKWIKHPVYFTLGLSLSAGIWAVSKSPKKNDLENIQLSSFSENLTEVKNAEKETVNRLPVKKRAPSSDGSDNTHKKELPKKFSGNPAFILFEKIQKLVE